MSIVKNVPIKEIFKVADQVEILGGQIVSKTIVQNKSHSITIFAFDKDEEISTHAAKGDAFVTVVEGKGKFIVDGEEYILEKGQSLIMPANIPHSVYGHEKFKMLLVVVFEPQFVQIK